MLEMADKVLPLSLLANFCLSSTDDPEPDLDLDLLFDQIIELRNDLPAVILMYYLDPSLIIQQLHQLHNGQLCTEIKFHTSTCT